MFNNDITIFAETTFRNKFRKFGIKRDDRRRHMYLIGKTGMGKSTILENMIVEDIRAGKGVAVVDPHGDLAEKIIQFIPSERINDVVYFNPGDMEYPTAFNVVEHVEPHLRHLVASGLLAVFKKLWADSWGPRLEYILRNAILAVLDYPGSTLLAIIRMLTDKPFRKKVIDNIKDPVVKAFWVNEFAGYNDKFASEAVAPIQNKVGQFLSSSLIRNIVGQVKSSIDVRSVMDNQKILILNLSKGRIGEDNSELLGAMMITKIQLAAMSRVDMPEDKREDFYLYVDEFQNFATEAFSSILSEARKYHLNLILAHQYIEQLIEDVRNAIFGNVGTLVIFRVGAADAEALAPEFAPVFTEEDIVNLPKYEIYLKLMIDGVASEPFSARGLAPLREDEKTGNLEKVIKVSRERYSSSREIVEEKIARWHESEQESKEEQVAAKSKSKDREDTDADLYKHTATCATCGKETKTSFEPDGVRPVFCKNCLSKTKEERRVEMEVRKKMKEEELKKLKEADSQSANLPVQTPFAKSVDVPRNRQTVSARPVETSYAQRTTPARPDGTSYAQRTTPTRQDETSYAQRSTPARQDGASYAQRSTPARQDGASYAQQTTPAAPRHVNENQMQKQPISGAHPVNSQPKHVNDQFGTRSDIRTSDDRNNVKRFEPQRSHDATRKFYSKQTDNLSIPTETDDKNKININRPDSFTGNVSAGGQKPQPVKSYLPDTDKLHKKPNIKPEAKIGFIPVEEGGDDSVQEISLLDALKIEPTRFSRSQKSSHNFIKQDNEIAVSEEKPADIISIKADKENDEDVYVERDDNVISLEEARYLEETDSLDEVRSLEENEEINM